MAGLVRAYNRVLQAHPWKTQMFQTGLLMGAGDLAAQTLVEKKRVRDVDSGRLVRFTVLGTVYVAPIVRVSHCHSQDHFRANCVVHAFKYWF
jgi:hypothetical protein